MPIRGGRANGRGRGGRGGAVRGRGRGRGGAAGGRGGPAGGAAPFSGLAGFEAPPVDSAGFELGAVVEFAPMTPGELRALKVALLNTVSASLVRDPSFDKPTSTAVRIAELVSKIAWYDPEFILKVALYARTELNIRSTTNFVLSLAANLRSCGAFFKKYFGATTRLPSDWLDVAATYQLLPGRALTGTALPTCLRKAMVDKFADFDSYQLAKYNREGAIKRKKKKLRMLAKKDPAAAAAATAGKKPSVTLKQMIRQLHVSKPPYAVMCILGKKYPATESEFRASGLPGEFDGALAGKRMKLPVPETWETLVSQKGNKASTWEELIEHKKLPFMAMLRNLRNLIFTGVHPKYHRWVMNKLKNEQTIASSKQFPFRFFSAYEVIPKNLDDFRAKLAVLNGTAPAPTPVVSAAGSGDAAAKKRKRKHMITPEHMPTPELFGQYREALDTAVKLATTHNVKPIRGATAVFCDASQSMRDGSASTGVGKFNRLDQIGTLLGLMCMYVCECADFQLFGANHRHIRVELREGTILDNMAVVEEIAQTFDGAGEAQFPFDYLETLIAQRKRIDNLIVLSHHLVIPGTTDDADPAETIGKILAKYRREVNPGLLFVSVDLSGRGCSIAQGSDETNNPNDILVSGFSDAILRFIAERGDTSQLQHVEHIDAAHKLKELPPGLALQFNPLYAQQAEEGDDDEEEDDEAAMKDEAGTTDSAAPPPPPIMPVAQRSKSAWKTARVFISSTFLDMHGERDMLTRKVFPELRERCARRRIHLDEVDLRWGVTEKESQEAKGVEVCLSEVMACCPLFIGFVGSRYGWCPPGEYPVPQDDERFAWVKDYPRGRSITELEMHLGAIRDRNPHAFFYFRDPAFAQQVPAQYRSAFAPESIEAEEHLAELRENIRDATRNVVTYPATWAGVVDGKPMAGGLEPLQQRILEDIWNMVCSAFPIDDGADECDDGNALEESPLLDEAFFHDAAMEAHCRDFVGRKDELKALTEWADAAGTGLLALVGPPGCGRSALAAQFATSYAERCAAKQRRKATVTVTPTTIIVSHFVGASPLSQSLRGTLSRLILELDRVATGAPRTEPLPQDAEALSREFARVLEAAAFRARIMLVLDGIDQLSTADHAHSLAWLPPANKLPAKVLLTFADIANSEALRALRQRKPTAPREIALGALELRDRRGVVERTLARHHKQLDERAMNDQMRMLLKKSDSGKPLFLVMACEELRVFGVYEALSDRIRALSGTLPKLGEEVLDRLELDHGAELVANALAAVVCSRGGLHEAELLRVLRRSESEEALPRAVWAPLGMALKAFVRCDVDGLPLSFASTQFRQVAEHRYAGTPQKLRQIHAKLATHFMAEADPHHDGSFTGATARGVSEVAYHLTRAQLWPQLVNVLTSLAFVERKCALGMIHDLIADFLSATTSESAAPTESSSSSRSSMRTSGPSSSSSGSSNGGFAGIERVKQFASFVAANAHVLGARPHLTFQQAANQPDSTAPAIAAMNKSSVAVRRAWIKWINKPQALDVCKLTFKLGNDDAGATAVAFSPDGMLVAFASQDCTARVHEATTGRQVAVLRGHSAALSCLAFSPDGRLLATGAWDCTAKVWDARNWNELSTLSGHDERISAITFTTDGAKVLTASWDLSVRMWNAEGGDTEPIVFNGHTRPANAISVSVDGKHAASASWSGEILLWNIDERKLVKTFRAHGHSVRSCTWRPTGATQQLATCSTDGDVLLWDTESVKQVSELGLHAQPVNFAVFAPTAASVATASDDASVRVWDASLGREVSCQRVEGGATLLTAALSPNRRRLLTATNECEVVVWDIADDDEHALTRAGIITGGHTQLVNSAEYHPSGRAIATASADGTIKVWDATTFKQLQGLTAHTASVNTLAFAPDGNRMVSGSDDNSLIMWDVSNAAVWKPIATLRGHTAPVRSVAYAPNGKHVVSAARDGTIRVWHVESAKLLHTLTGHQDWINAVSWAPDSKHLVSSSWDFNAKTWSMKHGKESHTLRGHSGSVELARYSPDGAVIATASYDGTIRAWDAKTGADVATLRGHGARVNALVFIADRMIITTSDDGTMRIWELLRPSELARLVGHSAPVRGTAFSPDGEVVASASDDATVRLWNWRRQMSSSQLATSQRHAGPVTSVVFSPQGDLLVTAAADGSTKLWDTTAEGGHVHTLIPHGENVAVRSLAVSASGAVISAADDGSIRVWSRGVHSGEDIGADSTLSDAHAKSVRCVALGPDGTMLASAGWDCKIALYRLNGTKQPSRLFELPAAHNDWPETVAFSADGTLLASGGRDCELKIWSVAKRSLVSSASVRVIVSSADDDDDSDMSDEGSEKKRKKQPKRRVEAWVSNVAWSPAGKTLAVASWDGNTSVWTVTADGSQLSRIATLGGSTAPVMDVKWAPNGRTLITVSGDCVMRLWDVQRPAAPLLEFMTQAPPTAVAISAKAQLIVIGDVLGNVYLCKYNRQ